MTFFQTILAVIGAIAGLFLLYVAVRILSAAVFRSYWEEKENAIKKFLQSKNQKN